MTETTEAQAPTAAEYQSTIRRLERELRQAKRNAEATADAHEEIVEQIVARERCQHEEVVRGLRERIVSLQAFARDAAAHEAAMPWGDVVAEVERRCSTSGAVASAVREAGDALVNLREFLFEPEEYASTTPMSVVGRAKSRIADADMLRRKLDAFVADLRRRLCHDTDSTCTTIDISNDVERLKREHTEMASERPMLLRYEAAAKMLWTILDNIDTSSDALKPSDLDGYKAFYEATMRRVAKRHSVLTTDGEALRLPPPSVLDGADMMRKFAESAEALGGTLIEVRDTATGESQVYGFPSETPKTIAEATAHAKTLSGIAATMDRSHPVGRAAISALKRSTAALAAGMATISVEMEAVKREHAEMVSERSKYRQPRPCGIINLTSRPLRCAYDGHRWTISDVTESGSIVYPTNPADPKSHDVMCTAYHDPYDRRDPDSAMVGLVNRIKSAVEREVAKDGPDEVNVKVVAEAPGTCKAADDLAGFNAQSETIDFTVDDKPAPAITSEERLDRALAQLASTIAHLEDEICDTELKAEAAEARVLLRRIVEALPQIVRAKVVADEPEIVAASEPCMGPSVVVHGGTVTLNVSDSERFWRIQAGK